MYMDKHTHYNVVKSIQNLTTVCCTLVTYRLLLMSNHTTEMSI